MTFVLWVFFSSPDDQSLQTVSLDFGDDVTLASAVTRQFLITNLTAIPAPFAIEVQYFSCSISEAKEQPEKRYELQITSL